MNAFRRFGSFWYNFIIGDDWKIAFGVAVGLSLTALSVHLFQLQVWWLLPFILLAMLSLSIWLATRRH